MGKYKTTKYGKYGLSGVSHEWGGDGQELPDVTTHNSKQQLALARQAHAKGTMASEDFIWTAMQCYAAEHRQNGKRPGERYS